MSGHKFGIFGGLSSLKPGDRGTLDGRTIEVTQSRPTEHGGDEYVNPEKLGAPVVAFTCYDPKKIDGKWTVKTSWVVTFKYVD